MTGSRWRRGFSFSTMLAMDEVRSERRMEYANSARYVSCGICGRLLLHIPLRSPSVMCMTQSGSEYCISCSIPPSPRRDSVRITMSLPVWLRVSSEYPSSNLLALMEEAGRKFWRYAGVANGVPTGPAMAGDVRRGECGRGPGLDAAAQCGTVLNSGRRAVGRGPSRLADR